MADLLGGARFIVNRTAGRSRIDLARVLEDAFGRDLTADVRHTEYRGHAEELARSATTDGINLVVAVGGDGTVNEVGRALLNTKSVLGVVPTGSGNAFARVFGVPLQPRAACQFLFAGPRREARAIDAGFIDNHCFLSSAGIGIDAQTCSIYASRARTRRGLLPYLTSLVKACRRYQPIEVTIAVDGDTPIRTTPALVTIANGDRYGYGALIAPGAEPDDGELDLCVFGARSTIRLLWDCRRLFIGGIERTPDLLRLRGRTIRIDRGQPGPIQADGEAFDAEAVLDIRVEPGALLVAAPG